jgi:hypothetical protein
VKQRLCGLFYVGAAFLAIALASQRFFRAPFLTGLQVKRMPLDFLNDVFLLHLALKPAQRAFERFAVLHNYFSQT